MTPLYLWPFVLAPLLAAAKPPLPQFATRASAIYVDVAVSKGDRPVEGLSVEDFEVKDNGVLQKVSIVSREEQSVHAVLVLDLSDSLSASQKQLLRDAAASFLAKLEPRDRATLLTFTNDLRLVIGPDAPPTVRAAIGTLDAAGLTSVHDALFAAISVASTAPGRAFVVLFSDGLEMTSWLRDSRVEDAARHADATVYHVSPNAAAPEAVGLTEILNERLEGTRVQGMSPTLEEVVRVTGGRTWHAQFGPALEDSFQKILDEVQNRYLLMYEPAESRPGWHSLKVKLKKRKGDVRVRRGYFATP